MRFVLAAALACLVPAVATAQESLVGDAEGEALVLGRINTMRNATQLPALERDPQLDAAARTHAADMAWNEMLEHVSPRTGDPDARVAASGYAAARVAQIIARRGTPLEAYQAIIASDVHRSRLLDPGMRHVGLAIVEGQRGLYMTIVVAEPRAAGAPAEAPAVAAPATPPSAPPEVEVGPPSAPAIDAEVGVDAGRVVDSPVPPPAPPAMAPRAEPQRRVTGYWVQSGGRWWFYPLPPNAQPGQPLQPAPVQPRFGPQGPAYGGAVVHPIAPPPPCQPAPPFGWSPRRHPAYWQRCR